MRPRIPDQVILVATCLFVFAYTAVYLALTDWPR